MNRLCAICLLLLVPTIACGAIPAKQYLAMRPYPQVLPTDAVVGTITDTKGSELAGIASQALRSSYDLQWLQQFVQPSARSLFAGVWGDSLASVLPATYVLSHVVSGDVLSTSVVSRLSYAGGTPDVLVESVWSKESGSWLLTSLARYPQEVHPEI